jgi:hypothetical protein
MQDALMSIDEYFAITSSKTEFINLLSKSGSVDRLCEIFKSSPECDPCGLGNDQPSLLRILAKACKSSEEAVSTNAFTVLFLLSNQALKENLAMLLPEDIKDIIFSPDKAGSDADATRLPDEAVEEPKKRRASTITPSTAIEERCAEITLFQRASRLSDANLRTKVSEQLIRRSGELLPEIRMNILEGLVLVNLMDKEYLPIAKKAAEKIVNICMEKSEGQPEGERSRRISDALRFFESLPYCTYLFCKQINELDAAQVSEMPLAPQAFSCLPEDGHSERRHTPLWNTSRSRRESAKPGDSLHGKKERPDWWKKPISSRPQPELGVCLNRLSTARLRKTGK